MPRLMERLLFGTLISLALTVPTHAQTYPSRPIRFIVPYAPGGGADIVARAASHKMSEGLGVSVVVDNRVGAAGDIGSAIAAKAPPDGHTLLMGNVGPIAINVSLNKQRIFDPIAELAPVSMMAIYPNVLVVTPSLPVKTVNDLVQLARARPGQLSHASSGNGSSTHLAAELLKTMAHINITHVPYKGGSQAVVDVISGQVHAYFSSAPGAMPHVKTGKLRALGVTSAKRMRAVPEVPTIAESGFPGYEAANWVGLLVPARTPPAIITRLNTEVVRVLRQPDIEERLTAQGGEAETNTPQQFAAHIKTEIKKWAEVIKAAGLKPE